MKTIRVFLATPVAAILTMACLIAPSPAFGHHGHPNPSTPPPDPNPDPTTGHFHKRGPSMILERFEGLADPVRWSVHRASGRRFRRATAAEIAANRWQPGTFLVEAKRVLNRANRGSRRVSLLIPTGDRTARRIRFRHTGSFEGPLAVETRANTLTPNEPVLVTAERNVVHRYQSAVRGRRSRNRVDIRGGLMKLTATDGGVAARGAVEGMEVRVNGPSTGWYIDDVAGNGGLDQDALVRVWLLALPDAVGGSWNGCDSIGICDALCGYLGGPWDAPEPGQNDHPCSEPFNPGDNGPTVAQECNDDLDNDGDGAVDHFDEHCDHTHNPGTAFHIHQFESGEDFGLFGDGTTCTYLGGSWKAEMIDMAITVSGAFKEEGGGALAEKLRWGVVSCWIFGSQEDAEQCDATGACAPFNSGSHTYPYAGANGDNADYRTNVVYDLNHARVVGLSRPITILHVIHRGDVFVGAEAVCGNAFVGAGNPLSGRSVSSIGTGGCSDWKVTAHEIGHTLGAGHETYPAMPPHTFMYEGHHTDGFATFLSPANALTVEVCLGTVGCPRFGDWGTAP